jgi:serine phosphatase RsbU (regulator of sigma subunit)
VVLTLLVGTAPPPWHEPAGARARLTLLSEASENIGSTLDVDTTSVELARFTVPRLADLVTVDLVPDAPVTGARSGGGPVRVQRTALASAPGGRRPGEPLLASGHTLRYRDGSAAARCVETGRAVLGNRLRAETLADWAADDQTESAYRASRISAALVVPLTARGHLVGVMSLARRSGGARAEFEAEDVFTIQDVADRAAISLDNARRYARSQGITLDLQRALLAEPGSPHPNLELASRYLPSGSSSMVGGDWFETIRLSYRRTLLVIGDVMGHGVDSAVDMSAYRSMLRYVAPTDLPPHRILLQLDRLASEGEANRPATCLLALIDPARGRCTYASAGHLPPALITPGEPTRLLDIPTGPPLGTGLGDYTAAVQPLHPEQVLLLYTDGLVERRDEDIDVSLARLTALQHKPGAAFEELLDTVLREVAPANADDDIAVLAARVRS